MSLGAGVVVSRRQRRCSRNFILKLAPLVQLSATAVQHARILLPHRAVDGGWTHGEGRAEGCPVAAEGCFAGAGDCSAAVAADCLAVAAG